MLFVSGNTENHAGRIDVRNLGKATFDGSVTIHQGGIYFYDDATGKITGNLDIKLDGICWRYKPGVLTIEGTIHNDGELNNDGEIVIGKP